VYRTSFVVLFLFPDEQMKKLRWPLIIALLALVVIGALLVSQRQDILTPIIQPEVIPAEGGVYAEGLVGSLMRLNPLLDYSNRPDRDIDRLIFSGLLRFDDHGLPKGDLASSWGISRDGTIYNFSIRDTAVWHDGQPVTSDDVIFTIEMMRSPDSSLPADLVQFWQEIELVRLDEKTLQFRLPESFAPFMDYLTFGVLPAHLLGDLTFTEIVDNPFNLQPVGSGPYRFDHLIVENGQIAGLVLSANKDFYAQTPYIEQIAFRYYPTSAEVWAAFQAGDINGISQVSQDILPQVLSEPTLNTYTSRLPQLTLVLLNLNNPEVPFFQDSSIRRALMQAINRQQIIDSLFNGQAILADGPIFPGTWSYYTGTERIAYDPQTAISVLRQAGFTIPAEGGSVRTSEDGVRLAFEMVYPDNPLHQAMAQAIQASWAQIGVEVTLTPIAYDLLVSERLDPRFYQAALVDLNLTRSPDPDPYPFWHQAQITGGQNYSGWDDRQASEYLEQARITLDLTERQRLYNNFQVRFSSELPALSLYYPVYTYAVTADMQGVSVGPLFDPADRFAGITNWFLVTRHSTGAEATQTPSP
jgi:peptide/nickel transport system substrate-binding protein